MATDWIQSLEGRKVTPRDLQPDQVGSIEEIAHALAGKVRFCGQTLARYSVAEHCVRGSRLLPAAFAGAFLLHELSEVYLPDVPAPLKPFLRVRLPEGPHPEIAWDELEDQHARVMLQALGLASLEPLLSCPEVRRMDLAMLAAEKRDLCGVEPEPWGLTVEAAETGKIYPWAPGDAALQFVSRFNELFR